MADQRRHVDGGRGGIDGLGKTNKGWEEIARLSQQIHRIGDLAGKVEWRRADTAITDDHGGDALSDLGEHLRLLDRAAIIMGMHVDEARRKIATFRFNYLACGTDRQVTDGDDDDTVAANADIRNVGVAPGAINNKGATNNRLISHCSLRTEPTNSETPITTSRRKRLPVRSSCSAGRYHEPAEQADA